MVVAQRHPTNNRITGEGTVHSYNSSQLSCLKEYEGVEGNEWNVASHQTDDIRYSHNRYSQEKTNPNATVITPSQWTKNTSLHQEPQPMGISEWNNNTQYSVYTNEQEVNMDNFGMVRHQRYTNDISVHILTFSGPTGGRRQ